ncbi:cytochrome c oxidase subunit II [Steroidobacter cummioxidans]|uniref:cytochrome c oxidase subunit II n=1 Tax=Steroidobacter cummioxidans TaxID=1803913 RepID=UPI000E30CA1D|nr:cytochrome c oxidase subunit II [Steroidobacter cummioxidans]
MTSFPLSYLDAAGRRAAAVLPLTWAVIAISALVCLIIALVLWRAVVRARANGGAAETRAVPVTRGGNGVRWIGIGLIISAVPLLITLVWTMVALASVSGPPTQTSLTLDVTPRQWWWEVHYASDKPAETFSTANEIHIPVGVPVLIRLHGADVIHSFWVPKLTGKTDAIPGQTNLSWMQADSPGRYRGQCAEFCGFQHARMAFEVVAQPQDEFERWRAQQLKGASPPQTEAAQRGLQLVEFRCGACHRVRGTSAGARSAPDLTHLMSRRTIAAGTLSNNSGNLAGWIQDPQGVKPGSLMPNQYLSSSELNDALAYLETLQ